VFWEEEFIKKGWALYPSRLKHPLNSMLYETLHEQHLMQHEIQIQIVIEK